MKTATRIVINNECAGRVSADIACKWAEAQIGLALETKAADVFASLDDYTVATHGDGFGNWEVNILPHEEEKR